MNESEIIQQIGKRKVVYQDKWLNAKDLSTFPHFLVYGDDGGDAFVKICDTPEQLEKLAQSYVNGHTDCDFETRVYLICRNNKQVKAKIILEDV